jgi:hypothetical protein
VTSAPFALIDGKMETGYLPDPLLLLVVVLQIAELILVAHL